MHYRRTQYIAIERERLSVVIDYKEVSEFYPVRWEVIGECCCFFHRVVLSRCSSDPCQFFRVSNDADRLNLPMLDIHSHDEPGETVDAANQRNLTIDFP